jgi:lipopolysaccharide biosynthesis glycosyltransferase
MYINKFFFIFILLYLSKIEIDFLSDSDDISYHNNEELKNYNNISISYGLNNNNFYPTLVSITSILENANNSTFYIINILVSKKRKDFSEKNERKFKNLEKIYKRCEIIIFRINDKLFKYANTRRYPVSAYYRLLLAELIPNTKRIIYLDGDTIILSDLSEMINLEMKNNIIMGFLDNSYYLAEDFGIKTYKYITTGVLLINLEIMKKENITYKFFKFIKKYKHLLKQEDQTIINIVLNGRIGILPPIYGMWDFNNITYLRLHNHYLNYSKNVSYYKDSELIKGLNYPSIIHYVFKKPYKWGNYRLDTRYIMIWFYYAQKTKEYKNIINYYNFKLLK